MKLVASLVCLALLALVGSALVFGEETSDEVGFAGVQFEPVAIMTAEQKAELGITGDHGIVIAVVTEGGPAERAGLKLGDYATMFGDMEVPDLTVKGRGVEHHTWRLYMRTVYASVRAGKPIPVQIVRGGKEMTLTIHPVSAEEAHRLQGDEAAAAAGPVPALADAGPARSQTFDFESLEEGAFFPFPFHPFEGRWRVGLDPVSPGNHVLRQDHTVLPWAVLLVAGPGCALEDGRASIRFYPVSGVCDASAGIIFRAQDEKNYYVVRPNALEDNFRIYIVKDGIRTELGSLQVTPPVKKKWHTLEVSFEGTTFRATFDGAHAVEAHDDTFTSGWCGLWTKADSITLFDDFTFAPTREGR